MGRARAITEFRPTSLVLGNTTNVPSLSNLLGAIQNLILDLEFKYNLDPTLADLAAVDTFITGNHPFEGYVVTVTTDLAAGIYTIDYVETRPNATNDI